ncbi:hypothetical protein EJ08DRAFT_649321 [Tothia fuscella]|uniref:non-specific serine/threonine protein kinase n=1 Tax=Tothia fuscella TaxID=1048955 RepID=A0A9P4TZ52_9PEZI|nr:hypothetical protein EJ08DRAFT_649321 [Tothia fuscella]
MPPRKHVYGKRARPAFALSSIFSSRSSPEKPEGLREDEDDDVASTVAQLGFLAISNDDNIKPRVERPGHRRALSSKDGNIQLEKPVLVHTKKEKLKNEEIVVHPLDIDTENVVEEAVELVVVIPSKARKARLELFPTPPPEIEEDPGIKADLEDADPHIQPLLSLSNHSHSPQNFTTWSQTLEPFFIISKIAEASYGEVYRLSLSSPHPTFTSTDESVLKILALKPLPSDEKKSKSQVKREANMSSISIVLSETQLLKRLTEIPGFTNYRALHILQGRPSSAFITAWKEWNKFKPTGEKSAFPDPSRKANYSEEQLWAVIEMQDAGTDVEKLQELGHECLSTVEGVWDIFWQVALAVGKGEELAAFEHRDLHLGNICVKIGKKSRRKGNKKLGFTGLETTIIDYTLSRAEMPFTRPISSHSNTSSNTAISASTTLSQQVDSKVEIAYLDLSNSEHNDVFTGDATNEYQYDIYRYMRNAVYFSNALHDYSTNTAEADATGRSWRGFHPQTNLVWLHFVLKKLLTGMGEYAEQGELQQILGKLEGLLNINTIPREGFASVRDLIVLALGEGWLDEVDVVGEPVSPIALPGPVEKKKGRV